MPRTVIFALSKHEIAPLVSARLSQALPGPASQTLRDLLADLVLEVLEPEFDNEYEIGYRDGEANVLADRGDGRMSRP